MTESPDALVATARERGLSHVVVGCTDWNGRLRTKQLHVDSLAKALCEGTALTTAIFATDSAERPIEDGFFQDPANGYPDARLRLDSAAARTDPFTHDGRGLIVVGNLEGEFGDYCPRALASRQCMSLRRLGFDVRCGFEIEAQILAETPESLLHKVPGDLGGAQEFGRMYSHVDQALAEPMLGELRAALGALGIPIESLHTEFSGLLEAAMQPATGVTAADDLVLYKAALKTVARRHSALAIFMAKLSDRHESAGAHLNLSVVERATGTSLFGIDGELPPLQRHFLGGLQRYTAECFVLYAPNLNSYKRFGAASFVPRTNTWARDNKTAAFRVVTASHAEARIEIRVPGADVNPYLALAATLAAGRRGLEMRLEPAAEVHGNAWGPDSPGGPAFPATLHDAVSAWRASEFAREAFGSGFVAAYAQSREWQLEQFARTVTDWEVRQFAECV